MFASVLEAEQVLFLPIYQISYIFERLQLTPNAINFWEKVLIEDWLKGYEQLIKAEIARLKNLNKLE